MCLCTLCIEEEMGDVLRGLGEDGGCTSKPDSVGRRKEMNSVDTAHMLVYRSEDRAHMLIFVKCGYSLYAYL